MSGDRITMSQRERDVLKVMAPVLTGQRTQAEAARLIGRSIRQARRIQRRLEADGDAGVVHRLRGRPSNRQIDRAVREQAVAAYRADYGDFGPTLAAEKLVERGVPVTAETLRRWLLAVGLWQRRRRREKHRSRRTRRGVGAGRREPPRVAGGSGAMAGAVGADRRRHQPRDGPVPPKKSVHVGIPRVTSTYLLALMLVSGAWRSGSILAWLVKAPEEHHDNLHQTHLFPLLRSHRRKQNSGNRKQGVAASPMMSGPTEFSACTGQHNRRPGTSGSSTRPGPVRHRDGRACPVRASG